MNIPTDAMSGSPTFTIDVSKREDGKFEASCPSTKVPPSVGDTRGDAIQAQSLAIYEALQKGEAY